MKPRHEYDEALGAKGVAPVPFAGPLVLFRRLWRMASEQFRNATSAVVRLLIFGEAALFSIGDAHFAQGESERRTGIEMLGGGLAAEQPSAIRSSADLSESGTPCRVEDKR